jgi:hypothetical protein
MADREILAAARDIGDDTAPTDERALLSANSLNKNANSITVFHNKAEPFTHSLLSVLLYILPSKVACFAAANSSLLVSQL